MRGKVIAINHRRGMFVVETDSDGCSIVEELGGYDTEIGDIMDGALDTEGSEEIKNITKDENMDVMIQNAGLHKKYAIQLLAEY